MYHRSWLGNYKTQSCSGADSQLALLAVMSSEPITSGLEFGWRLWSSCRMCQSALRCILQGFLDLDAQLFSVKLLSVLTFWLCTDLKYLNYVQLQLGHSLGFAYQPLSAKSSTSLLNTWAKTAVRIYLESQNTLVEDLHFFHSSFVMGFLCLRTDFPLLGVWPSFCTTQRKIKTEKNWPRTISLNRTFFQWTFAGSYFNLDRKQPGMMQRGGG